MKESANPSSVPTNITFITMSLCCSFTLTRGFAPFFKDLSHRLAYKKGNGRHVFGRSPQHSNRSWNAIKGALQSQKLRPTRRPMTEKCHPHQGWICQYGSVDPRDKQFFRYYAAAPQLAAAGFSRYLLPTAMQSPEDSDGSPPLQHMLMPAPALTGHGVRDLTSWSRFLL